MRINELTNEELEKARIRSHLGTPSTFTNGWLSALEFVRFIESCACRCAKCHTPVQEPHLFGNSNYGGDICGELTYCKECWKSMSDDEKKKIAKSLTPRY